MNQVRIIADQTEFLANDLVDVIVGATAGVGRFLPFDLQPKTSFEIAWDLAH